MRELGTIWDALIQKNKLQEEHIMKLVINLKGMTFIQTLYKVKKILN